MLKRLRREYESEILPALGRHRYARTPAELRWLKDQRARERRRRHGRR